MTDKELELHIKKILDRIIKNGAYNMGDMLFLKDLYYSGRAEVQNGIKALLEIEECELH